MAHCRFVVNFEMKTPTRHILALWSIQFKTMRYLIIIFGLYILTSCTYRPKEKRLTQFNNSSGRITKSFYKKDNDTIEFQRILINNTDLILQTGQIFLGEYALTHQRFKNVRHFKNDNQTIDSLTSYFLNEGHKSKLVSDKDVMFIQIIPDSTMGNIESLGFLNLRQDIEERIDERLKSRNLGEWFAGDMGAGGNMLFFINDWDKAAETVNEVLQEENLLDHVLIAKRIMTTKDDWNYEIVYPVEYEGVFNQM
jgi:hypothetical protein